MKVRLSREHLEKKKTTICLNILFYLYRGCNATELQGMQFFFLKIYL